MAVNDEMVHVSAKHFIEIAATKPHAATTLYWFFGLGVWKVKDGDEWKTINSIYVPGRVLKVAAAHCEPAESLRHPVFLTEREIARLCGGRWMCQSAATEDQVTEDQTNIREAIATNINKIEQERAFTVDRIGRLHLFGRSDLFNFKWREREEWRTFHERVYYLERENEAMVKTLVDLEQLKASPPIIIPAHRTKAEKD